MRQRPGVPPLRFQVVLERSDPDVVHVVQEVVGRLRRSGVGGNVALDEVARMLFYSRTHVLRLVHRDHLRGTVGKDDKTAIDEDSARAYLAERASTAERYFRAQTEDDDPLGI